MDETPVQDELGTPVHDVLSTPAKHGTSPGWGHIAQLQTPASAKRRDTKARVKRFARAGKQQGPAQAQAAGPTAQSILSVKRTLSFNACRENVEAGIGQQAPNITRPENVLKAVQPSTYSHPDASDLASVPTTFAAHFAEAAAKDSGAGGGQKKRQSQPQVKFQASKNRGVRDGGHDNFVRLASKKGKSSFTYKSKSGSSNKNPKNRKWAARKMAAESLPVAGLGADSTKEAHLVCFKCGQKGHWAADCKSELPTGQKENVNMAWCVTDTSVLDAEAGPLPAFLRADAVATLASHGALASAYLAQGGFSSSNVRTQPPNAEHAANQGGVQQSQKDRSQEQNAGYNECLADLDACFLDDCFEAATTQVGSAEPTAREQASPCALVAQDAVHHFPGASTSQQLKQAAPSDVAGPSWCDPDEAAAHEQPGGSLTVYEGQKTAGVDDTLRSVLRDAFGFDDFRSFQLPVIRKLLQGSVRMQKESCMVVQPTGSGKSLCFQLPAVLLPGLVIVVSPLTAHARDAVSRLPKSVPAGLCLGGDFKRASMATLAAAAAGRLKLLYITPECLATSWVAEKLGSTHISLVCVDEAHVASAMSPSCRAGCLRLPTLVSSIAPDAVRLLLTATAAPEMRSDLASVFDVKCSSIWTAPPVRPELTMRVERHLGSAGDGRAHSAVLAALAPNGPLGNCKCTLVYCTFCAHAEQLASYLQGRGVAAASYHGSLSGVTRQSVAKRLAAGELKVVTCTTALSSGLDLHNIDGILHHTMPASLEDYVQQIGRAGRAGQPANALVLLRDADLHLLHSLKHSSDCDLRAVRHVLRAVLTAATSKVEITTAAKKKAATKAKVTKAKAAKAAAKSGAGAKKRGKKKGADTDDLQDQEDGAGALAISGKGKSQKRKRSQKKPAPREDPSDDDEDEEVLFAAEELALKRRAQNRNIESGAGTPDAAAAASDRLGDDAAVGDNAAAGEEGQPRRSSRLVRPGTGTARSIEQPSIDEGLEDSEGERGGEKGSDYSGSDAPKDSDSDGGLEEEDEESDYEEKQAPQKRSRGSGAAAPGSQRAVGTKSSKASAPAPKARRPQSGAPSVCASEVGNPDVAGPCPSKIVPEADACRDGELAAHAMQADGEQDKSVGNKASGSQDDKSAATGVGEGSSTHGSYIVLQLRDTATGAQITLDTIQTMLALLERAAPNAVRVLGNVMPAFKVACYKRKVEELAEREPLFAAIQSVARIRNGTLSAKMQDVARTAHVAPDAVEDLLQRLAAKGEVHLEGKRDFSVALWVDPDSDVWQGIAEQQQAGAGGTDVVTGDLARDVLASMNSLQNTLVSKLELAYKALNATQQLPAAQQSDALTACISREFPAHTQDAPAASVVASKVHNASDDACIPTMHTTASGTDSVTAAAKAAPSRADASDADQEPCEALNSEAVQHASFAAAAEPLGTEPLGTEPVVTEPAQPDLPFEAVGKMTSIRVAATVEHATQRAGEQVQLTARAIASIMHGRDTPAFPRSAWSKCPGWGSCMHVRFAELRGAAQKELLRQAGSAGPR